MKLNWPLMENNITRQDLDVVIDFLKGDPILTQSLNVKNFEKEWCEWLGVKYSVFVNSGSSANIITLSGLKQVYGLGEIIVPPLTWVSDISSVIINGFKPVFVDIDPKTLCMNENGIFDKLNDQTKAVFLTHAQGFNGLSNNLLNVLKEKHIPLIEDVCESHGATFEGKKLGSYGLVSNFSFYFAHHMSTIEGGMICTNDEELYQIFRMYRSHGMIRESTDENLKNEYINANPELNPDFIFAYPGFNMRSNEISAVLGRNQLKRLDRNNIKRIRNFELFLGNLDPQKYRTNFDLEGSCNYAFNLVLRDPSPVFCEKVMKKMKECGVEFRRGSAGGGNQLRQPYLKGVIPNDEYKNYPEVEHIHFYGFYMGNYPGLQEEKIHKLCQILNEIE
jgi:CDP-4-dehydro-6-deoxyglucose reductase, E1